MSPTTRASKFPFSKLTKSMPTCFVASSRRSARIRASPREISGCCVRRFRKSARVSVKTGMVEVRKKDPVTGIDTRGGARRVDAGDRILLADFNHPGLDDVHRHAGRPLA